MVMKGVGAQFLLVAAAQLLPSLLPGADPPAPAQAGGGRVLLWIRAGALSASELDPDPETTPRLRELVLRGVTAAELAPRKEEASDPGDPSALASALFDAPLLEQIGEALGSKPIRLGPEPARGARKEEGSLPPAPTGPAQRSGLGLLVKRFGAPPPPAPGEEASILRIRSAIGEPPPPEEMLPPAASPPGGSPEPLLSAAESALSEGSPLVIVCERVEDPSQAPERDRALGGAAERAAQAKAVFLVVSASGGSGPTPSRITLVATGPGVRRGRLIAEARPLGSVAATVLAILGVRPAAGPSPEGLDVLER